MSEWIASAKRLPKKWREVIIWDGDEVITGYVTDEKEWRYANDDLEQKPIVTHWMPLPEPPSSAAST